MHASTRQPAVSLKICEYSVRACAVASVSYIDPILNSMWSTCMLRTWKNQWRVLRQILPGAWFISNFLAVQCLEWPSVTDWCILMLVAPSVDSLQGWKTNYIPAQLRSKCCSICGVAPVKPSEFWVLKMICIYILFFKYNYILHIIHILRKPAEGLGWV